MNQLVADLKAARKLIENPENWCKGDYRSGKSYCVAGALARASSGPFRQGELSVGYDALRAELPLGITPVIFNDEPTTTHADILALFDRAIARAEQQP